MKKNKKKNNFINEDFIDIDLLIPSNEEMERTINNILKNKEISLEDMLVLKKMKLIKMIKECKGVKI